MVGSGKMADCGFVVKIKYMICGLLVKNCVSSSKTKQTHYFLTHSINNVLMQGVGVPDQSKYGQNRRCGRSQCCSEKIHDNVSSWIKNCVTSSKMNQTHCFYIFFQ